MSEENEWWKEPQETSSSKEKLENSSEENIGAPGKNIVRGTMIKNCSLIFLLGMFLSWNLWLSSYSTSGLGYIFQLPNNLEWFIDISPEYSLYVHHGLLGKIYFLLYIISPLILSINILVLLVFFFVYDQDIGKISSTIHFSVFFIIFLLEFYLWGEIYILNQAIGFNILLLTGLGLNPSSSLIIFEKLKNKTNRQGGLKE